MGGFEFVSVFAMVCHGMQFYGAYVGEIVGKATREGGCCVPKIYNPEITGLWFFL